jgi:hypothetical protein
MFKEVVPGSLAADRAARGFKSFSGFGSEPDDEVGRR